MNRSSRKARIHVSRSGRRNNWARPVDEYSSWDRAFVICLETHRKGSNCHFMPRFLLPLILVVICSLVASAEDKPNILFFFVDDMGWQDTSVPFHTEASPTSPGVVAAAEPDPEPSRPPAIDAVGGWVVVGKSEDGSTLKGSCWKESGEQEGRPLYDCGMSGALFLSCSLVRQRVIGSVLNVVMWRFFGNVLP